MKHIAFLTSGGDSPGMNACIRAIVKSCLFEKVVPYGIRDGYKGMIAGDIFPMRYEDVNNIVHLGGTILGTARSEEFKQHSYRKIAIENLEKNKIDGLIVIGGDGTYTGASILSEEMNIPIIGIPGTIDNDIYGTDHTIGYDSALNTVIQAVDKIRDTAYSHHRIFFVEVMGRNSGFIALNSALASGAESVIIPESVTDIQSLVEQIKFQNKGKRGSIIIVAEGDDAGGSLEIIKKVSPFLPEYELKATVLGHIQRGGSPSAFDRILSVKMGAFAVQLLLQGESKRMVAAKGEELISVPIIDGISKKNNPLEQDKLDLLKRLLTHY